jgi:hypothetical protein
MWEYASQRNRARNTAPLSFRYLQVRAVFMSRRVRAAPRRAERWREAGGCRRDGDVGNRSGALCHARLSDWTQIPSLAVEQDSAAPYQGVVAPCSISLPAAGWEMKATCRLPTSTIVAFIPLAIMRATSGGTADSEPRSEERAGDGPAPNGDARSQLLSTRTPLLLWLPLRRRRARRLCARYLSASSASSAMVASQCSPA